MKPEELLQYRRQLIEDTVRLRKRERVPHFSNIHLWLVLDYGVKLTEACSDWELMEKCQLAFYDKYKFDLAQTVACLLCHPMAMIKDIGQGFYIWDDVNSVVSLQDTRLLLPDEYEQFIADLPRYTWEVLLPRKYERWPELKVKDMMEPLAEYQRYTDFAARMGEAAVKRYGIPKASAVMVGMPGIELLCNLYTGMKGLAMDMRRQPEQVKAAVQMLESGTDAVVQSILEEPRDTEAAFDVWLGMLAHNFLSIKQWEAYYWPYLKKLLDAVVAADKTAYIFVEGYVSRFYDYFRTFPAGHIALHIEQDDVYEVKKNLPNCCIVGGMSSTLLGSGTKEQCIDRAKQLIDDLGQEGGFILSQDKMISYMRDANPENLKAVCDFVSEYHF
jgi:uroporphyrinogen-III decarboxylase